MSLQGYYRYAVHDQLVLLFHPQSAYLGKYCILREVLLKSQLQNETGWPHINEDLFAGHPR